MKRINLTLDMLRAMRHLIDSAIVYAQEDDYELIPDKMIERLDDWVLQEIRKKIDGSARLAGRPRKITGGG